MRRWGHGHSLGFGALFGILLTSEHTWTLLVIAAGLGFAAGRFLWLTHWAGAALRERVMHARRERIGRGGIQPVYTGKKSAQTDTIPWD
jgi:hypothetical protein